MAHLLRFNYNAVSIGCKFASFKPLTPALRPTYQTVRNFASPTTKNKSGKKGDKKGEDKEEAAYLHAINDFHMALEKAAKVTLTFTEEENAKNREIVKEYSRQLWKRKNKFEKDLADKQWLRNEAMAAMPEEYRQHALIIDRTIPPPNRYPYWDTPPIKGFNYLDYFDSKNKDDEEAR